MNSNLPSRDGRNAAFTLVELLVVIAIIGVLVALLLPAVQAAREAARRTTCLNQMRQFGVAALNHESSYGVFPGGGIHPWPQIELYSTGDPTSATAGKPFGPDKQGLSWAFQILPFLEQGAVHNLSTTVQIVQTPINQYFCPSRRPPTQGGNFWLMDYSSLTPAPPRGILGDVEFEKLLTNEDGCRMAYAYWGDVRASNIHSPQSGPFLRNRYGSTTGGVDGFPGFKGIIVRSSYLVKPTSREVIDVEYDPICTVAMVEDGTSNTAMFAEKRLISDRLDEIQAFDDRGWSDGWDLDTVKSTICQPRPDGVSTLAVPNAAITSGSAHSSGQNVIFADASGQFINYDIDLETWNRLGHRADGEVVDAGSF